MMATAPHTRFREARERAGLSIDEVATRSGISDLSVWDLEQFEGDLTACYSPKEVQLLCKAIGISPIELFGDGISEAPVAADELIRRIHEECDLRGITLEQFEDAVGWRLSKCMQPPDLLLADMSIDGLQWLCRELKIDWRRVLLSLDH
jgi:hypothetical protein